MTCPICDSGVDLETYIQRLELAEEIVSHHRALAQAIYAVLEFAIRNDS